MVAASAQQVEHLSIEKEEPNAGKAAEEKMKDKIIKNGSIFLSARKTWEKRKKKEK